MMTSDLFPDEDYRFRLNLEREDVARFFAPTEHHEALLAERARWIQTTPDACVAALPEAAEVVMRFAELVSGTMCPSPIERTDTLSLCAELGRHLEPDFLVLKPDREGTFRLVAGCVCFPSSWSLPEKMGRPLGEIHGVVPGLNASLGRSIDGFLSRLKPGTGWRRANWGLSRSPELNQNPERRLPRLDAAVRENEVWLRIEHQILTALPTGGILFGIRIESRPLVQVRREAGVAAALARALRTMPEEVARYKGLATARTT
ncbi:MAG TPA: DUF3445 domain-containing protein, partial [Methylomirabilota bacterium]|nr:DUF3445 domain-containing protein [Methylomirabilota bacterium]